ncbi:MAG TPA: HAD hydrolase family protein [Opitutaceae bacterium]|jgi:3-deoxy-D-manno-octulosonate 8-phosphate phosphatase (KDO 8-P phosphatase)|nr:HAD hydrolase family protein [Opitutaceae bacterium]
MPAPARLSLARWARIRLFAMDVDGILTDGGVFVGSDRTEFKRFSVRDGLGLGRLRDAGLPLAWISGRASGATLVRAEELKIPHLIQNRRDKLAALTELAGRLGVALDECVYMGDDIIDAAALAAAGIGVTVPGADAAARKAADCVTVHPGGDGAVREVCDRLWEARERGLKR